VHIHGLGVFVYIFVLSEKFPTFPLPFYVLCSVLLLWSISGVKLTAQVMLMIDMVVGSLVVRERLDHRCLGTKRLNHQRQYNIDICKGQLLNLYIVHTGQQRSHYYSVNTSNSHYTEHKEHIYHSKP